MVNIRWLLPYWCCRFFLSKAMERFYEKVIFCFILSLAFIEIDAL